MEDAWAMNDAKPLETSEQHARLAAIYDNRSADLSPELAQRRSMLAHYHALAKAALRREALKVNPNRLTQDAGDGDQLAFAGF